MHLLLARYLHASDQNVGGWQDRCHRCWWVGVGPRPEKTESFNRLTDTAPEHAWEPLLEVLFSAKIEKATEETAKLCNQEMKNNEGQERHFTNSKVLHAHVETKEMLTNKNDQCGNDARVFNLTQKAINRWTTLPLPTTDTWIQATEQDPDPRPLKQALTEKTVPLKAALTCKKHHDKLTGQSVIIEEGVLCQLEQLKATKGSDRCNEKSSHEHCE